MVSQLSFGLCVSDWTIETYRTLKKLSDRSLLKR